MFEDRMIKSAIPERVFSLCLALKGKSNEGFYRI